MKIARRAFLASAASLMPMCLSLSVPCDAMTRKKHGIGNGLCGSQSLAHDYLSLESGIGAETEDWHALQHTIDLILIRIQPTLARYEMRELTRIHAVVVLNEIGEAINKEGFRMTDRSTLLFESIRTKLIACHYAAALIFSIGEQIGLPLLMVKVPCHVFLRLRLGDGKQLNWDVYLEDNGINTEDSQYKRLFNFDNETAKRAGYLRQLTQAEMMALECNAIGAAWKAKDQFDRAIGNFSMALALDPKFPEAYKNRGLVRCQQAACMMPDEPLRRDQLNSAVADLNEAVRLYPRYAEALYHLGVAHFALNDVDSARICLQAAINLEPAYMRSKLSSALSERSVNPEFQKTLSSSP